MGIRLSKTNTYISEGAAKGIVLSKTNTYISEGPIPGGIVLAKTNTYFSEGPVTVAAAIRRRLFFIP